MTCHGQPVPPSPWHSHGTSQSPRPSLTCRRPRGMPAPAAPQRSGSGPSVRCPAALPCSVGSGDGSEWPLRTVLSRQRPTDSSSPQKPEPHTLPHTVSLPAARTWALERLKGNYSTQEHHVLNPLAPRQDITFSAHGLSSCEASA